MIKQDISYLELTHLPQLMVQTFNILNETAIYLIKVRTQH